MGREKASGNEYDFPGIVIALRQLVERWVYRSPPPAKG